MQNLNFLSQTPNIGTSTRVAQQAIIFGDVTLGEQCSVWPYAVVRGDVNSIVIGNGTNLQENVVVHVSHNANVILKNYITVGHGAIIHGCHIDDHCLIGMNATVLDGAKIGHHCIIGANALIPQNKEIPPYSLVLGTPGKIVRTLSNEDIELIHNSAQVYIDALEHFPF